jgi:hypothetical protein
MAEAGIGPSRSHRKEKNRLPPFVPLLITTLDSPAWKALSHGARSLYVGLKRRCPNASNRAYLSFRDAENEIRASQRKIGEWFKELSYYGFIVLAQPVCLGVEGKGKAPHWRLTEKGVAGVEYPTNNFLRWNGVPFKRTGDRRTARFQGFLEKQNPADGVGSGVLTAWDTPKSESASDAVCIGSEGSASDTVCITSLPLGVASKAPLSDDPF